MLGSSSQYAPSMREKLERSILMKSLEGFSVQKAQRDEAEWHHRPPSSRAAIRAEVSVVVTTSRQSGCSCSVT